MIRIWRAHKFPNTIPDHSTRANDRPTSYWEARIHPMLDCSNSSHQQDMLWIHTSSCEHPRPVESARRSSIRCSLRYPKRRPGRSRGPPNIKAMVCSPTEGGQTDNHSSFIRTINHNDDNNLFVPLAPRRHYVVLQDSPSTPRRSPGRCKPCRS